MCVALYRPHIAQTGPPGSEWPHTRGDGPAEKVRSTQTPGRTNLGLIKTKDHMKHINSLTFHLVSSILSLHLLPFLLFFN